MDTGSEDPPPGTIGATEGGRRNTTMVDKCAGAAAEHLTYPALSGHERKHLNALRKQEENCLYSDMLDIAGAGDMLLVLECDAS